MRRSILTCLATLPLMASAVLADEKSSYVVCDNGLRCVRAPCPSASARDLADDRVLKGLYPDLGALSEAERARIRETDALYYGRLVLRGHIETRQTDVSGRRYALSHLVVTGIERDATAAERRHCPAG